MKPIDADVVVERIKNGNYNIESETSVAFGQGYYAGLRKIQNVLSEMPRLTIEKQGEWQDVGNVSIDDTMTVAICSQCKKELTADRFDFWDYDFCPYCGSKLK